MKLTLRVTLTTTLVTLIVLTFATLGFISYRSAQFTARDLSSQILDETSRQVESELVTLLDIAKRNGHLDQDLLRTGQFDSENFDKLAQFWISVMKTHPRLTRKSIGLANGEWSLIRRSPSGRLVIGELRLNRQTGKFEMRKYWSDEYPAKTIDDEFKADANDLDPRRQPWYTSAARAGKQTWSDDYLLEDVEGFGRIPGVSCSTPFYDGDGKLKGVLTSTYDVESICEYLRGLQVGKKGFVAFVVEVREDGQRRVIAHPRTELLVHNYEKPAAGLRTPDALSDTDVGSFLEQLDTSKLDPSTTGSSIQLRFKTREGVPYFGAYHWLSAQGSPTWMICSILPEEAVLAKVAQSDRESWIARFALLFVVVLVGLFVSAQVARPLERVVKQTEKIGKFEVGASPIAHSMIAEVDNLACVVEQTKTNLRSFGKYVPIDVIQELFVTGQEASLGGARRRITVSFSDLANFTTLAEGLPPEELVLQMGDYFARFSAAIIAQKGTVDKYIGDAIMAFWGAPVPSTDHAVAACVTALHCQDTMKQLNLEWAAQGKPELAARVGVMTGDAVVGNVGSPARLNYTAMGDTVNLASRLEGLGKQYGARLLIGEPTYQEARSVVVARAVDRVTVKGKTEGMMVYELLAMRADARPEFLELADLSDRGLGLYLARDWEAALDVFEEIGRLRPGDGPARVLADRCRTFLESPPAEDWDGAYRMANK
jgi:adenylate cyclase